GHERADAANAAKADATKALAETAALTGLVSQTGNQLFATNQAVSTAQSDGHERADAANAAKADATKALAETAALTGLVSQT
ncbi:hypothetical protein C7E18_23290, partial [Stenotrophomonas maltophilia]